MQTSLPTEPGAYLFCGVRDQNLLSVRDLVSHPTRPELVRVHRHPDGKLSYTGTDFFYSPERAMGTWLRLTDEAEALQTEAHRMLFDEVARTAVPKALTGTWNHTMTRASIVSNLTGPFEDSRGTVERLVDRAVELDSITPAPDWKGAYTLPGVPK